MNKNQSFFLLILFGFISIVSCSPKKKKKSENRTEIQAINRDFKDPCLLLYREPNFKMNYELYSEIKMYKPDNWRIQTFKEDRTIILFAQDSFKGYDQLQKPFLSIDYDDVYHRESLYEDDALAIMFRKIQAINNSVILLDSFKVKINNKDFLWMEYFLKISDKSLYCIDMQTYVGLGNKYYLTDITYIEPNKRPDIDAYRIMNSIKITQKYN